MFISKDDEKENYLEDVQLSSTFHTSTPTPDTFGGLYLCFIFFLYAAIHG